MRVCVCLYSGRLRFVKSVFLLIEKILLVTQRTDLKDTQILPELLSTRRGTNVTSNRNIRFSAFRVLADNSCFLFAPLKIARKLLLLHWEEIACYMYALPSQHVIGLGTFIAPSPPRLFVPRSFDTRVISTRFFLRSPLTPQT